MFLAISRALPASNRLRLWCSWHDWWWLSSGPGCCQRCCGCVRRCSWSWCRRTNRALDGSQQFDTTEFKQLLQTTRRDYILETRCSKVHEKNMERKTVVVRVFVSAQLLLLLLLLRLLQLANTIKLWAGSNCDILCTLNTPWWSYLQEKLKNTHTSTIAIQLIPHKHREWYTATANLDPGPVTPSTGTLSAKVPFFAPWKCMLTCISKWNRPNLP